MKQWQDQEVGPKCKGCGKRTQVVVSPDKEGYYLLVCMAEHVHHSYFWYLPRERPATWPKMTDDDMQRLVDAGAREQGAWTPEEN